MRYTRQIKVDNKIMLLDVEEGYIYENRKNFERRKNPYCHYTDLE